MAGMQKVHVIKNLNSKVSWVEKNLKINKWGGTLIKDPRVHFLMGQKMLPQVHVKLKHG